MTDGPLSFLASWKGFLPPNAVVMAKRSAIPATAASIAFAAPDLDDADARAMLDKIIAALELRAGEFEVVTGGKSSAAVQVYFTAGANDPASTLGMWSNVATGAALTTYSLRAMLESPGLKKAAWSHLKDAVARMRRDSA